MAVAVAFSAVWIIRIPDSEAESGLPDVTATAAADQTIATNDSEDNEGMVFVWIFFKIADSSRWWATGLSPLYDGGLTWHTNGETGCSSTPYSFQQKVTKNVSPFFFS